MSLPHNYCAFLPDQQYHPHKHCILKVLFSHANCSEVLILPCSISRMIVSEEKTSENNMICCNIHESNKCGMKET
jgi:hypothetical protein